jgi:hypothetical protein
MVRENLFFTPSYLDDNLGRQQDLVSMIDVCFGAVVPAAMDEGFRHIVSMP